MDLCRPSFLLLALLLLNGCLCTEPTRSHRQKRGIMKMMMHIMWDPVRLIRYWYAYDVTKEIAKSWRKILPTILLLPVTKNSPHSYNGIAKYVHPTIKLKGSPSKKAYSKYYNIPENSHHQKLPGKSKHFAMPSDYLHQELPSRYPYPPELMHQYYDASQETVNNNIKYDHNNMPPVIVGHVPHGKGEDQYTVAHYYMRDSNSKEQQTSSSNAGAFLHAQHGHGLINHDDISSSSSPYMSSKKIKKRPGHFQSHIHYVPHIEPHGPTVHDASEKEAPLILHPGQEFRIVLHPIPVSDFNPNSLQPSLDGQAMQFVPVNSATKELQGKIAPILFKAVSERTPDFNSVENRHPTDTVSVDDPASDELQIDRSENNSVEDKKTKYNVTWIAQKSLRNTTRSRKKDEKDLKPDGTMVQVSSIHKCSTSQSNKDCSSVSKPELHKQYGLNKYNINMKQLREDLKHGTPVLIPFNKNAFSPGSQGDISNNNQQITTKPRIKQDKLPQFSSPISHEAEIHATDEHSSNAKSTHRLLLLLKKKTDT